MATRGQEALCKQAADYAVHQFMKSHFRQATSIQPRTGITIAKVLSRTTENDILRFIVLFCGLGLGMLVRWGQGHARGWFPRSQWSR